MTKSSLLLRHRDFAFAWTGGLVSLLGTWALWIALPIHVYAVSGSTLATGAVVACVVVPGIVLGSVAGVFVDRWNRKTTLVVGNLLLAAATLPLLLVGESRLWVVYPAVVLLAVVEQFTEPAENAFLPRLVAPDELLEANALNALNNSLARLIGPALGGTLYAVTGLGGVVLVDAASFAIAAALLASVRASGAVAAVGDATAAAAQRWRRLAREWADGIAIVRRERAVGVVFGVNALTSVGEGVFAVMFVVWVREVLDAGAPVLGWLQTSQAAGALVGGAVGAYAARRLVPERLYAIALLSFGIGDLMLFNYPRVADGIWIGLALMVLVGIPGISIQAGRTTILQTHVEDAYRGRVFGALGTNTALLAFVGTLLASFAGGSLGPLLLLNVQGGVYVVSGLLVLAALAPGRLRPARDTA
jgi:Na+/melibiose symporter-like transporter